MPLRVLGAGFAFGMQAAGAVFDAFGNIRPAGQAPPFSDRMTKLTEYGKGHEVNARGNEQPLLSLEYARINTQDIPQILLQILLSRADYTLDRGRNARTAPPTGFDTGDNPLTERMPSCDEFRAALLDAAPTTSRLNPFALSRKTNLIRPKTQ